MGSAASVSEDNGTEALAKSFQNNFMAEIADVVRAQSITLEEFKGALKDRRALVAFFASRNYDLNKLEAEKIMALAKDPETIKREIEAAKKIQAVSRGRKARQKYEAKKFQGGSSSSSSSPTRRDASTSGGGSLEGLQAKLEKLDAQMNSVKTYHDSQTVLRKWCTQALGDGNVSLAIEFIKRNSVLMAYMNDDVAMQLAVDLLLQQTHPDVDSVDGSKKGGDEPHIGQLRPVNNDVVLQLLHLVKDDSKITVLMEGKVATALEQGKKELARSLALAIRDPSARKRVLGEIDLESTLPNIREAVFQEGDVQKGLKIAMEAGVNAANVDEILEEALKVAAKAGDLKFTNAIFEGLTKSRVAGAASRALSTCVSLDVFRRLLQPLLDACSGMDEQVQLLSSVGCTFAKQLKVNIANYCMDELRKQLDPNHAANTVEPPEDLCCPITTQIMRQPVKTPAGHLYDRSPITQWVMKFHSDPMTREPLNQSDLVNDNEAKVKVDAWLADNATFLRGEKILKDIFYIQWNFGVKWALGGEIEKVAANLKQVAGRDERQRLLTDLGLDVVKLGKPGEHIGVAKRIAALAKDSIDVTVVALDIATRTIKELKWTFMDWRDYLPSLEAQREVKPVALRFYFAAYAAAHGQLNGKRDLIVSTGNAVAYQMADEALQQLRMQLETEAGMSNDHIMFPFKRDEPPRYVP